MTTSNSSPDGAVNLDLPWEELVSVQLSDDEISLDAKKLLGFRYAHWAKLNFKTRESLCIYCPQERDYELAIDRNELFDGTGLADCDWLKETDKVTSVELIRDSENRVYSLTIGTFCADILQIVSGEFENLYEPEFGDRAIRLMDEMLLVFSKKSVTQATFESYATTLEYTTETRKFY